MEKVIRLDSTSPSLATAFRKADDDQRRRVVLATCLVAIAQTGLQGSEVDAALAILRGCKNEQPAVRSKLDLLAKQLDEQYFELSNGIETSTPRSLEMFRRARAAAALAFALSPNSEQLHEAVYEAIVASSDRMETLRVAEAALKAR